MWADIRAHIYMLNLDFTLKREVSTLWVISHKLVFNPYSVKTYESRLVRPHVWKVPSMSDKHIFTIISQPFLLSTLHICHCEIHLSTLKYDKPGPSEGMFLPDWWITEEVETKHINFRQPHPGCEPSQTCNLCQCACSSPVRKCDAVIITTNLHH